MKYDELGNTPGILKKLVYCADCGRSMVRYKSVTCRGTKKIYFYKCPKHEENPGACPIKYIPEEKLLEILWDTLESQISQAAEMSGKLEDMRSSKKQADAEAAQKLEASRAAQELKRARTLYDGLYPMYAVDRALTEQEYTRMRQEYRTRMEQAEKELESINGKIKERTRQMEENRWLKACEGFNGETGITEEMAHGLLSRVEIGTGSSVSISLRWQDEYRKLAEFLESEKGDGQ